VHHNLSGDSLKQYLALMACSAKLNQHTLSVFSRTSFFNRSHVGWALGIRSKEVTITPFCFLTEYNCCKAIAVYLGAAKFLELLGATTWTMIGIAAGYIMALLSKKNRI
jgi:hypothetical protein